MKEDNSNQRELAIKIVIDNKTGKIGTAIARKGFKKGNIADELMVLGILENLKSLQQKNLKIFGGNKEE